MTSKSQAVAPLPPGQRLGDYEILFLIARHGQAQVYLARVWQPGAPSHRRLSWRLRWFGADQRLIEQQRLCVIKVALPGWVDSLRDEHTYLRQIRHDRLARIYSPSRGQTTGPQRKQQGMPLVDMVDSDGQPVKLPYLALHYEPGGSLKALLEQRQGRPLPPPVAVAVASQVAEALEYLHTSPAQLVHHDISPSNILFRRQLSALRPQPPDCVVIDMAAANSPVKPRLPQIYGKRVYLPPERQVSRPESLDWTVDVYGLGVVLYEMLAGRLPERGSSTNGDPRRPLPHIREYAPGVSDQLSKLVMAAVSHEPSRRPSMAGFRQQLGQLPESSAPASLRGPWDRRSVWPLASGALGMLLALLVLTGALLVPQVFGSDGSSAAPVVTATPRPTITPLPQPTAPPTLVPTGAPTSTPAEIRSNQALGRPSSIPTRTDIPTAVRPELPEATPALPPPTIEVVAPQPQAPPAITISPPSPVITD